jgi:hypothetical protein
LGALDDREILALVAEAADASIGIGGTSATLSVDDIPVFLKRVPLTDLERRHSGSTRNYFGLPMYYQYGLGSAGFGVWREVAVHAMTTDWVLQDRFQGFPLLYHWRVLPLPPPPLAGAEVEHWVARWDGSSAVRARMEAISTASAAAVLFLEHVPYTVNGWLSTHRDLGAFAFVEKELAAGVAFMGSQDLLHFDAHFENLLADGHRVYFSDFGLAISKRLTSTRPRPPSCGATQTTTGPTRSLTSAIGC